MSKPDKHFYEFGPYTLTPTERQLRQGDAVVALEPKVFETLLALVERSGKLATKEELLRRIWPDTFVEEINLARNISILRKTLAQGFAEQPCIETVPRYGYRFIAAVNATQPEITIEHTTSQLLVEEEIEVQSEPQSWRWPRVAALSALLVAVCALAGFWLVRPSRSTPVIESLAVLPFKSLDQASNEPYLQIGMADTLITRLSALNTVRVRPTSAIRGYAEAEADPLAAGRALGVEAVLEGSLQRLGDRLRVTVRLLRVSDGQPLWAHQCDTYCTDIFQTQDAVSRQVAEALRSSLSPNEQQALVKRGTNDAEAYQLYLKGQYFFSQRTRESLAKAQTHFEQALARDPDYAQPHVGLAHVYRWLSETGAPSPAWLAQHKAALQRALALDAQLPEAHAALGLSAMNDDWDWALAEQEFKRAIALNPNYATAHHWYGEFLSLMGRPEEAYAELSKARELDPLSLIINTDLGKVLSLARRYDEAIAQYQKALELNEQFNEARVYLAVTYALHGQPQQAEQELNKIENLANLPLYLCIQGYVYGVAGKQTEARRVLARLQELARTGYVSPFWVTWVYAGMGERDAAFAGLERVFAERSSGAGLALKVSPFYDPLRADPRFADLLRRAGHAR